MTQTILKREKKDRKIGRRKEERKEGREGGRKEVCEKTSEWL